MGTWRILLRVGLATAVLALAPPARAATQTVFSQPPSTAGGLICSSWVDPNGSDADMYVYDSFILSANAAITEVDWRGGYLYGAPYGKVLDFSVTIFESIAGGSQPHVGNPQLPEIFLAQYAVGGIAGETPVASGPAGMYDYRFVLPSPFQAAANTKYWIRLEASQPAYPDWGIAVGTGGDNQHFQFSTGAAMFSFGGGDAAFTLKAQATQYTVAASASPTGSGTVAGAGGYASGALATLSATPSAGYGFAKWTENGATVSTSPTYTFSVTANRTLVAVFVPAYTITTAPSPTYGGSAAGGGTFNTGSTVTVVATPGPGYVFANWTDGGTAVSTAASYSFTASANRSLVANFKLDALSATFDFDTGTPMLSTGQGLPLDQTAGGITAHFGPGTGSQGFSIQTDGSTQFRLSRFSGHYVYPNSLGPNVLDVTFTQQLRRISLVFCTADFQQNEVPTTVQLTAYLGSTTATPVGSATAHGAYLGDTMPMGTLTYDSGGKPFNVVELKIPPQALASSVFLVDNITVTTVPVTVTGLTLSPASVTGGARPTATIALSGPARAGYSVTLTSSNTAAASIQGTLAFTGGATSGSCPLTTKAVSATTTSTITTTGGGVSKTAVLTVNPPTVASVGMNPASVTGGSNSVGTLTLNGPAPAAGVVVSLSSSNTLAATVPASVTVPTGITSATFMASSKPLSTNVTVTITATAGGATKATALTVKAPVLNAFTMPLTVKGGVTASGTVSLTGPAPAGGLVVSLKSSQAVVKLPVSVTVPAGASSVAVTATTGVVSTTTAVTLTATLGTVVKTAAISVTP